MAKRHNNQLPNNLPQLQNLMKRDADSYKDELDQQVRHFDATRHVFEMSPTDFHQGLDEMVMFLAQVSKCYQKELAEYPQTLIDLLKKHATVLHPDMRLTFCRALILLRHKGLLVPADLLKLFFHLLKCPDKSLRKFLRDNIVNDLKNTNAKHKDVRLNTAMQNFMFTMLKDSHVLAAKTSLDVMIELYRKNVWRDAKTANVISSACLSETTKLMVTGVKFFLGTDKDEEGDSDSDDDEVPTLKEVKLANKVNKKTKKREKFLENVKKAHKRKKKKAKPDSFNFSALHLIHDPQGFAEKLYKKMESLREKFEVKLMYLDLISRLIGTHELILLNYYPFISKFLNPHQREVVPMLQYASQAAHEMVPPENIEPVVRAIVNNFVTERNSGEVMAIGLNAVREIAKRSPLVLDDTLLRDLAAYKSYKDKAVMMAARSLIQLYRTLNPELLHKKDRGRPTEATAEVLASGRKFGEFKANDFVSGAEVLNPEAGEVNSDDDDQDDSEWEDVVHSSDEEEDEVAEEEDDDDDEDDNDENDENDENGDNENEAKEEKAPKGKGKNEKEKYLTLQEKKEKAKEVTLSRILTEADFKRINAAQLKKEVQGYRKGSAKAAKKRKLREEEEEESEEEENTVNKPRDELVDLANIEMVHKKRRHDKESRMANIMEGREDREKFGSRKSKMNPHASTTNKQKLKNKNFMMVKGKFRAKAKKSFVQKQRDLKRSLLRSKKFK